LRIEINKAGLIRAIEESTKHTAKDVQKVVGVKFTQKVIQTAAPQIQALLKMGSSLPTKRGVKMFYDDQTRLAYKAKGWAYPENRETKHLLEMWEVSGTVSPNQRAEGKIIIDNDKMVPGASRDWNLFQLLWEGTETYIAPVTITREQAQRLYANETKEQFKRTWKRISYKRMKYPHAKPVEVERERNMAKSAAQMASERHAMVVAGGGKTFNPGKASPRSEKLGVNYTQDTKGEEQTATSYKQTGITPTQTTSWIREQRLHARPITFAEKDKKGRPITRGKFGPWEFVADVGNKNVDNPKLMTFYNRYQGRFYYNQFMRKGIRRDVVEEFHEYIFKCLYRGLMDAIGMETGSQGKTFLQLWREARFLR
jgi:hypothetical protein